MARRGRAFARVVAATTLAACFCAALPVPARGVKSYPVTCSENNNTCTYDGSRGRVVYDRRHLCANSTGFGVIYDGDISGGMIQGISASMNPCVGFGIQCLAPGGYDPPPNSPVGTFCLSEDIFGDACAVTGVDEFAPSPAQLAIPGVPDVGYLSLTTAERQTNADGTPLTADYPTPPGPDVSAVAYVCPFYSDAFARYYFSRMYQPPGGLWNGYGPHWCDPDGDPPCHFHEEQIPWVANFGIGVDVDVVFHNTTNGTEAMRTLHASPFYVFTDIAGCGFDATTPTATATAAASAVATTLAVVVGLGSGHAAASQAALHKHVFVPDFLTFTQRALVLGLFANLLPNRPTSFMEVTQGFVWATGQFRMPGVVYQSTFTLATGEMGADGDDSGSGSGSGPTPLPQLFRFLSSALHLPPGNLLSNAALVVSALVAILLAAELALRLAFACLGLCGRGPVAAVDKDIDSGERVRRARTTWLCCWATRNGKGLHDAEAWALSVRALIPRVVRQTFVPAAFLAVGTLAGYPADLPPSIPWLPWAVLAGYALVYGGLLACVWRQTRDVLEFRKRSSGDLSGAEGDAGQPLLPSASATSMRAEDKALESRWMHEDAVAAAWGGPRLHAFAVEPLVRNLKFGYTGFLFVEVVADVAKVVALVLAAKEPLYILVALVVVDGIVMSIRHIMRPFRSQLTSRTTLVLDVCHIVVVTDHLVFFASGVDGANATLFSVTQQFNKVVYALITVLFIIRFARSACTKCQAARSARDCGAACCAKASAATNAATSDDDSSSEDDESRAGAAVPVAGAPESIPIPAPPSSVAPSTVAAAGHSGAGAGTGGAGGAGGATGNDDAAEMAALAAAAQEAEAAAAAARAAVEAAALERAAAEAQRAAELARAKAEAFAARRADSSADGTPSSVPS